MGRTNPTFRDELDALKKRWKPYRSCLRREDQRRFDELFDAARGHADACGHLNPHDPTPAVLLSMLLAQRRRIDELETLLEDDEPADAPPPGDDVLPEDDVSDGPRPMDPHVDEPEDLKGTPGLEDG